MCLSTGCTPSKLVRQQVAPSALQHQQLRPLSWPTPASPRCFRCRASCEKPSCLIGCLRARCRASQSSRSTTTDGRSTCPTSRSASSSACRRPRSTFSLPSAGPRDNSPVLRTPPPHRRICNHSVKVPASTSLPYMLHQTVPVEGSFGIVIQDVVAGLAQPRFSLDRVL